MKKSRFGWVHENLNLVALLLAFLGVFVFLVLEQISDVRTDSPLEISALTAAREISAVVIEDHYFGRIGLSNGPALSLADNSGLNNESVDLKPVRSLNSILAAVRLQLIVADLLASDSLKERAQSDYLQARRAAANLERELSLSLSPACKRSFYDACGRKVKPFDTAIAAYKRAAEGRKSPKVLPSFSLRWSDTAGATTTHIPAPYKFAFCSDSQEHNDLYRPGVDVSYGDRHFYFAAIGSSPQFVSSDATIAADGIHFSSLVCAQISDAASHESLPGAVVCVQPAAIEAPDVAVAFEIELPEHYHRSTKLSQLCSSELSGQFSDWLAASGGRVNVESLVEALKTDIVHSSFERCKVALHIVARGSVAVERGAPPPLASIDKAVNTTDGWRYSRGLPLVKSHASPDKGKSFLR